MQKRQILVVWRAILVQWRAIFDQFLMILVQLRAILVQLRAIFVVAGTEPESLSTRQEFADNLFFCVRIVYNWII